MAWQVRLSGKALKQFDKLGHDTQQEITRYLDRVAEVRHPTDFGKALVGSFSGLWRYRVGKYRMICEIQHKVLTVEVISIGKRDSVYD